MEHEGGDEMEAGKRPKETGVLDVEGHVLGRAGASKSQRPIVNLLRIHELGVEELAADARLLVGLQATLDGILDEVLELRIDVHVLPGLPLRGVRLLIAHGGLQ